MTKNQEETKNQTENQKETAKTNFSNINVRQIDWLVAYMRRRGVGESV